MTSAAPRPRSTLGLIGMAIGALLLFSSFVALGTWQVHRRAWKLDLIDRVEQRVHAPAVAAPPPAQWAQLTAANSEYRRVWVSGVFQNELETLVQATTDLGAGFWVLTPLREEDGSVVLINRGFVPPERRDRAAHGAGDATTVAIVTGLLRMTESGGAFLRRNVPAADRWYSRDVQAIAAARGLRRVAPYFVDEEASGGVREGGPSDILPVGGLTVVSFRNTHLSYAITWYTLALMVIVGTWIVGREEHRRRHR